MSAIDPIIGRFPKERPALDARFREIYERAYVANRAGTDPASALAQRLEGWMHRRVATAAGRFANARILELGAGNLNHLEHERGFAVYDVVEPFEALLRNAPEKRAVGRIYRRLADVEDGKTYDRVISVAVLEHMADLPREVALACRHLADGGLFQAGIPCEGEAAWWLGWRAGTGLAFYLEHGLDYGVLMRHEHLNTMDEILAVVGYFFERVTVRRSPFPLPLPHLSFYAYVEAAGVIATNVERHLAAGGRTEM